jgi:phytoene/squalene synthetase
LHGIRDAEAIAWSDAICTGLQLVNFWQDLSIDLPRGRCYVPEVDAVRWGVAWPLTQQLAPHDQMAVDSLVEDLVSWGRQLLNQGSPLVHRLPGRSGWELRAVIQGGLRIAEKVEQNRGRHLSTRVIIQRRDVWPIALRCMAMSWQASNHARIIQ